MQEERRQKLCPCQGLHRDGTTAHGCLHHKFAEMWWFRVRRSYERTHKPSCDAQPYHQKAVHSAFYFTE